MACAPMNDPFIRTAISIHTAASFGSSSGFELPNAIVLKYRFIATDMLYKNPAWANYRKHITAFCTRAAWF
uniref:Uncharacterized protein n=1 Tax=Oryza meridionalis TaxID=40149 RepID=A0A0E0C7C9_9ORYZ